MLAGRRVVLGVTGGVAAYKAAYLARRLVERGAAVRTVMTAAATEFIGPHTFAAITGARPVVDLFDADDVKVVVDEQSLELIDGTEVDYVREGLNEAFRFRNPKATGECGCGESFSI